MAEREQLIDWKARADAAEAKLAALVSEKPILSPEAQRGLQVLSDLVRKEWSHEFPDADWTQDAIAFLDAVAPEDEKP